MKSNVRIVELANYVQPEVKEERNREWVTYGKKNSFYERLFDRARGSVTNRACITSICDLSYGKGLRSKKNISDFLALMKICTADDQKKLFRDYKTTGQFALQIQYQGGRKSIKSAEWLPIQNLAPEKANEDGEIKAYYYADDWSKVSTEKDTTRIPVFGSGEGLEVIVCKSYETGMFYFGIPDWYAGIQTAELEEEISNYHLNNIQNGLAPSMFISMNNGIPESEEETDRLAKQIMNNYKGSSNAGNVIISFAENKETENTITPVPLSDASEQYQFLSEHTRSMILSAHKVPSPLLLGIPTKTGFSSNADELEAASILLETYVLNPNRMAILDALNMIANYNGLQVDLFYESLNPFRKETEQTEKLEKDLSDDEFDSLLDGLKEEVVSNEWELVDKREFNENNESIEDWASKFIKLEFIKSDPNGKSKLDKDLYKVRYEYAERHSSDNSRKFCKDMMSRTRKGVVYRHEDIVQASFQGVNKSFGHKGQNYSLFKYKGGVNCGHFWNENLYVRKTKKDGTPYKDRALSSSEEVDNIRGYNPKPNGYKESVVAPKDMPRNGHHPNYKG